MFLLGPCEGLKLWENVGGKGVVSLLGAPLPHSMLAVLGMRENIAEMFSVLPGCVHVYVHGSYNFTSGLLSPLKRLR